jgi:hypothetical protein
MEKQIERNMENLKRRLTGRETSSLNGGTLVDIDVTVLNIALTYRHCLFMLFPICSIDKYKIYACQLEENQHRVQAVYCSYSYRYVGVVTFYRLPELCTYVWQVIGRLAVEQYPSQLAPLYRG